MDVRQMSAVNHWREIWPEAHSLLGLYTRCVWILVEEFKFEGGYSGKTTTSWPIYDLIGHSWESCRWFKTCVIVCYQKHKVELMYECSNSEKQQCFVRDCD